MDVTRIKQVLVMMLAGLVLFAAESHAQADPEWLRSWNEAVAGRPATLGSSARIASIDEPGTPFVIRGTALTPNGEPASGLVIHAYHRDSQGFDFGPGDNSTTSWRLQGWAKTDSKGRFEFLTIRPAADHLGREAAHVHFTLVSGEYGRQWAPGLVLADDPLVTDEQRRRSAQAGAFGKVQEVINVEGVETINIMFRLKEMGDF